MRNVIEPVVGKATAQSNIDLLNKIEKEGFILDDASNEWCGTDSLSISNTDSAVLESVFWGKPILISDESVIGINVINNSVGLLEDPMPSLESAIDISAGLLVNIMSSLDNNIGSIIGGGADVLGRRLLNPIPSGIECKVDGCDCMAYL